MNLLLFFSRKFDRLIIASLFLSCVCRSIRFSLKTPRFFSSAPAYRTHVSADDHWKRIFSKTTSRVGIFENAICVLYACGCMDEVKLMNLVYMSRSHKMVPSPLPFSVNIRHLHISHNTLCQCPRKFCTIPGADYSAPDNSRFVVAIVQWGIEDNAPAKFLGVNLVHSW